MAIKIKKGFTLLEIVVVIAIFGTIMSAATISYTQIFRSANKTTMENELRSNLSMIIDKVNREVRKSSCFQVSTPQQTTLRLYSDLSCTKLRLAVSLDPSAVNFTYYNDDGSTNHVETITSGKVYPDLYPNNPAAAPAFSYFENIGGLNKSVKLSLKLNINTTSGRWDFLGTQIATQSISLRQLNY